MSASAPIAGLGALAGLSLCLCVLSCRPDPPPAIPVDSGAYATAVSVRPLGCQLRLVGDRPICGLPAAGGEVRLFVTGAPGATLTLGEGAQAPTLTLPATGEGIVGAAVAPSTTELALRQGPTTIFRLPIEHRADPGWLAEARTLRDRHQLDAAAALIAQRLPGADPAATAAALGELARIEFRRPRPDRSRIAQHLDRSLALARTHGLVYRLNDLWMRMYLLARAGEGLAAARRLTDPLRPLIEADGEALGWAPYYLGLAAYLSHDLGAARRLIDEARSFGERLDLPEIVRPCFGVQAQIAAELGEHEEARSLYQHAQAELQKAGIADADARCRQAVLQEGEAWSMVMKLEAQEEDRDDGLPATPVDVAAITPYLGRLREVGAAFRACHKPVSDIARAGRTRARLALYAGQPDEAEADLLAARRLDDELPASQREDLEEQGLVLLARHRWVEATARLERVAALLRAEQMPDQALLVLGRLSRLHLQRGHRAAALLVLQQAEQLLADKGLTLALCRPPEPGAQRRSGHCGARAAELSGHERMRRRLLSLLLKEDRAAEALAVVRRAHAQGLLLNRLRTAPWADPGEVQKIQDLRTALDLSQKALGEAESSLALAVGDAEADLRPRREAVARLKRRVEGIARDLFAQQEHMVQELAPAVVRTPPRPAAGEGLFTCHPLLLGWACFLDDGERVRVTRLALAPAESDWRAAMAAAHSSQAGVTEASLREHLHGLRALAQRHGPSLLGPFAEPLSRLRLLRVIPYHFLRHVDFAALPVAPGGPPIGERVRVVQSADLADPPARTSGREALLVVDPLADLPHASAAAATLAEALSRAMHTTLLQQGYVSDQRNLLPATGTAVLAQLARASYFHYQGHVEPDNDLGLGTSLGTALTRVTAVDVLALPRVPRHVVLIGCSSAFPGGDERLVGMDLAQAFVARGSEAVLAVARPIPDRLGSRMARLLTERLFPAGLKSTAPVEPDLPEALHAAQGQLRQEADDADGPPDWEAFRVLVR